MQIIDNVLEEEHFKELQAICGPKMPWHYETNVSAPSWMEIDDPLAVETDGLQSILYDHPRKMVTTEYQFLFENIMRILHAVGYEDYNLLRLRAAAKWPKANAPAHTYNLPHIDMNSPHKVIIFYMNDSDGDTVLFKQRHTSAPMGALPNNPTQEQIEAYRNSYIRSGFEIENTVQPKANRLVIFDGMQYHTAGHPVNTDRRVILNFNVVDEKLPRN
jgi:hypothetical protein